MEPKDPRPFEKTIPWRTDSSTTLPAAASLRMTRGCWWRFVIYVGVDARRAAGVNACPALLGIVPLSHVGVDALGDPQTSIVNFVSIVQSCLNDKIQLDQMQRIEYTHIVQNYTKNIGIRRQR